MQYVYIIAYINSGDIEVLNCKQRFIFAAKVKK